MNTVQAQELLEQAELIHPAEAVQQAVENVAARLRERLAGTNPVLLCIMSGAVPFVGHLLPRLDFPLDFDYLHVSRYGTSTSGAERLTWRSAPWIDLKDRTVLVVDDILDEGITLHTVRARLIQMGAREVLTAVFAEKLTGRPKPIQADFVGLTVPDRFVFGFGMDICGKWRNLPAIYAQKSA